MSIRRRLTVTLTLSLLILVGSAGLVLYGYVRLALTRQFDAGLLSKAQALHSLLRVLPLGKIEFDFSDDAMPEFNRSRTPEYFQLLTVDGENIERSDSLGNQDFHPPALRLGAPAHMDLRLPDGRSGRAAMLPIDAAAEDDTEQRDSTIAPATTPATSQRHSSQRFILIVARERADLDRTLTTIALAEGGGCIGLAFAVGTLIPWLVGRSLRPLHAIAEQATRIDASALGTRFHIDTMPAELRPICSRLNDLLERLQSAFTRERRFSADVAHELRTPIAELRLLSEVSLKFPPDNAGSARSFQDALSIAKQMGQIVEALLEMIGNDGGDTPLDLEAINVAGIIEQSWHVLENEASRKGITLAAQVATMVPVASNGILLGQIFGNLLTNAVEYSPRGAAIECRGKLQDDKLIFTISNPAPNLEQCDLPHLAEPFWRKDVSRTGQGHVGLGLALVRNYTERLNASIRWELSSAGIFSVTLELPL